MSREVCGICWCPYDEDTGECACTMPSDCANSHQPVAWYHVPYPNSGISPMVSLRQHHEPSMYGAVVPLYLATPQRKPLTTEEVERIWFDGKWSDRPSLGFVRAIEKAHGIGGKE